MPRLLIKNAKAIVGIRTIVQRVVPGTVMAELPTIENAWLTVDQGLITGFGHMSALPDIPLSAFHQVIDASGRYVLPGWCDPHTHTIFAAPREDEFVDKINGRSYQEIAARGGGILNSATKLRALCEDELYAKAEARLRTMMQQSTVAMASLPRKTIA